ncbi:ROK family protein [Bacillus lacus]|uniref:ROK family protein n=2 Tax=Metabacillus lacus TaxID=1983721 RepID=A0A7X2IXI8_9BACI|nr:ROK family transcriptional regulator [Metabacillus lacus]MRX71485.1 ROK family protein [Metabacillus lacus]
MKSLNRSLILNLIRSKGTISRAEIAKQTKLTPPTVTNIVNELLVEGLVEEGHAGPSNGGRKPIMLRINTANFFVIGIDVGEKKIRFAVTDLNANIIGRQTVRLAEAVTKDQLVQTIMKQIYMLVDESAISFAKILGIGIGMHGIVDHEKGIAVFAPNLNMKNIPLKELLEKEFHIPVKVENDVRAMALGESWFGNGADYEDIVCINVGYGIGAGIIMKNRLFRGQHGVAGEIGHTVIDLNGPACSCGNYGCLQAIAANDGMKAYVIKQMALGRNTIISSLVNGNLEKVSGKVIHQAALAGDALAMEVLENSGRYLGASIANLINVLNPERIIIGGGISRAGAYILDPIIKVVEQRALNAEAKKTSIVQSKLKDKATLIGAVTLVLADLFSINYESPKQVI